MRSRGNWLTDHFSLFTDRFENGLSILKANFYEHSFFLILKNGAVDSLGLRSRRYTTNGNILLSVKYKGPYV